MCPSVVPKFKVRVDNNITMFENKQVIFKCRLSSKKVAANITWFKDGIAFTDASATVTPSNQNETTELIVKIISVSDRHAGYYSCRATALKAQVSSRDAMLSLKGKHVD